MSLDPLQARAPARSLPLLLAAALAWPAQLLAFDLPVHERITREALKAGIDVSPEVLNTIVQANHDSDYHQDSPHRHSTTPLVPRIFAFAG